MGVRSASRLSTGLGFRLAESIDRRRTADHYAPRRGDGSKEVPGSLRTGGIAAQFCSNQKTSTNHGKGRSAPGRNQKEEAGRDPKLRSDRWFRTSLKWNRVTEKNGCGRCDLAARESAYQTLMVGVLRAFPMQTMVEFWAGRAEDAQQERNCQQQTEKGLPGRNPLRHLIVCSPDSHGSNQAKNGAFLSLKRPHRSTSILHANAQRQRCSFGSDFKARR